MNVSEPTWYTLSGPALHLRAWGEEVVAYDEGSGGLHVVNWAAAELLAVLKAGEATAPELAAHLAREAGEAPDERLTAYVRNVLAHLRRLDLVEYRAP